MELKEFLQNITLAEWIAFATFLSATILGVLALPRSRNMKQAKLRITFERTENGKGLLKITNTSKAQARNIQIQSEGIGTTDTGIFIQYIEKVIPTLEAETTISLRVLLDANRPAYHPFILIWSDDYKKNRKSEQSVCFA